MRWKRRFGVSSQHKTGLPSQVASCSDISARGIGESHASQIAASETPLMLSLDVVHECKWGNPQCRRTLPVGALLSTFNSNSALVVMLDDRQQHAHKTETLNPKSLAINA